MSALLLVRTITNIKKLSDYCRNTRSKCDVSYKFLIFNYNHMNNPAFIVPNFQQRVLVDNIQLFYTLDNKLYHIFNLSTGPHLDVPRQ